tara:strand:+ start:1119 stop:1274 length:156 start_codon:yes stop_codon:yes gene_type:complete
VINIAQFLILAIINSKITMIVGSKPNNEYENMPIITEMRKKTIVSMSYIIN